MILEFTGYSENMEGVSLCADVHQLDGEKVMNKSSGFAFALLGLIWGSNFVFAKWATALIDPAQVVFLRVLFGFLPILAFALYRRALRTSDLRHWPHFVVMAILATVISYYTYAKGAAVLPSSVAGMLSGAIPLFTFVLAALFLKQEPVTFRKIVGVGLGFLGVLLVAHPWTTGADQLDLRGVSCMILGSLSIGASFVYAKRFMAHLNIAPLALSTYQVGTALVVLAAVTPFADISNIAQNTLALSGLVLGLGLIGTGIAYVLYFYIFQRMGAVQASTVTYVTPVVALLIGCLFSGEPIHAMDLIAMASILGGVYATQTSGSSAKQFERSAPRVMSEPSRVQSFARGDLEFARKQLLEVEAQSLVDAELMRVEENWGTRCYAFQPTRSLARVPPHARWSEF
jgi:drug/metabolite transporter (DMT)-like permease